MIILVDNEGRENEGDLVLAADHVSPEAINFMIKEARGLVCLALSPEQVDRLQLPLMSVPTHRQPPFKTAFTVSVEAAQGITTGISAADRAHTISVASHPKATKEDIVVPGHVFPLRAASGGVLERPGHTEAGVDLAKLAGLNPAAVICEIINDDGTMARLPDLLAFAKKFRLKIGSIDSLIKFRFSQERMKARSSIEKDKRI
ncbi:MAG: 3,4-dihydroxy-2-butanone-4-phosphate synthase [Bdellovibrio sp.]|nr:MAG: 3,4-dihydroxy-2-butanone-4-phosphate synthase [Bdellovibrio sp.]